jgi:hypothetical protein
MGFVDWWRHFLFAARPRNPPPYSAHCMRISNDWYSVGTSISSALQGVVATGCALPARPDGMPMTSCHHALHARPTN